MRPAPPRVEPCLRKDGHEHCVCRAAVLLIVGAIMLAVSK